MSIAYLKLIILYAFILTMCYIYMNIQMLRTYRFDVKTTFVIFIIPFCLDIKVTLNYLITYAH